jgi:hypothetical protein
MGKTRHVEPARLFLALMWSAACDVEAVEAELQERYGRARYCAGPLCFAATDYYEKEMWSGLRKSYRVYGGDFDRVLLPGTKTYTNGLEERFSVDGRRTCNLDPGYLSRDKLALASTKDFFHRLYLGEGIFGETTLHFREGRFRHFSWTYDDYKHPEVLKMLVRARAQLVGCIRKQQR